MQMLASLTFYVSKHKTKKSSQPGKFSFGSKNNRKLPSLLLPLNLNLNYENFICFRCKGNINILNMQIFFKKNALFLFFFAFFGQNRHLGAHGM